MFRFPSLTLDLIAICSRVCQRLRGRQVCDNRRQLAEQAHGGAARHGRHWQHDVRAAVAGTAALRRRLAHAHLQGAHGCMTVQTAHVHLPLKSRKLVHIRQSIYLRHPDMSEKCKEHIRVPVGSHATI